MIATATNLITGHGCHSVLIASADKDLLALVSDRVEVHSTRTGNRIGPADVKAKLGVGPERVVDYLTLVGDASRQHQRRERDRAENGGRDPRLFRQLGGCVQRNRTQAVPGTLKPAQLTSLKELRPAASRRPVAGANAYRRAARYRSGFQAASADGHRRVYGGR